MRHTNVVFILTDDEGCLDLWFYGNPWVKTPYIDFLATQSVVFDDFHVQPLCTSTCDALMASGNPFVR